MSKIRSYVICTSPRSGSTLVCRLLAGTGVCGVPESYFHEPSLKAWLQDYGLNPADYPKPINALRAVFASAVSVGTCKAGVFGLRMQQHSFAYFLEQLAQLYPEATTDRDRFDAAFGSTRFIALKRLNKLEQAISYVKAQQSGLWHRAPDGTELERLAPPGEPAYDRATITRQIEAFERADMAWQAWFKRAGVDPLVLSYEDLARDPCAELAKVLVYLGVSPSLVDDLALPVAKLADAVSLEWAARFRAETR